MTEPPAVSATFVADAEGILQTMPRDFRRWVLFRQDQYCTDTVYRGRKLLQPLRPGSASSDGLRRLAEGFFVTISRRTFREYPWVAGSFSGMPLLMTSCVRWAANVLTSFTGWAERRWHFDERGEREGIACEPLHLSIVTLTSAPGAPSFVALAAA